jgi:hypothetical protein
MSFTLVRRSKAFFVTIALLTFSTILVAQTAQKKEQKAPAKSQSSQSVDKYEEVHRGLFNPQPDRAREAGRFTEEISSALPGRTVTGKLPRKNFIDEYIFGKMEKDGIPYAGLSSDEEFIRRAYVDATGLLPAPEKVREFMASQDPAKRDRLIDELVGTEEFAEQWAWFYGDLFRNNSRSGYGKNAFHYWMKEWLMTDRPYNEMVSDLITPSTKSHSTVPSLAFIGRVAGNNVKSRIPTDPDNYFIMNRLDTVDEFTVELGRVFLGINMDCVSCHDGAGHLETINSYLTERLRSEFHAQSAFFGKTRIITFWDDRAKNVVDYDYVLDDESPGYNTDDDWPFFTGSESRFPRSGGVREPAFFLTGEKPKPGENPRVALARMLTSHEQFGRATANLIWGRLMTVGFIEPYDSWDLNRIDPQKLQKPWTLQTIHTDLLNAMGADFKKNNYSIHHLIKTIMKSNAYQLSSIYPGEWKDSYSQYYARHLVRVMTGPEVVDVVTQATGIPFALNLAGVPVTRVKSLTGPGDVGGGRRGAGEGSEISGIMQSFFQSNRFTPVPIGNKASTLQAMLLMSSKVVNDRVVAEKGSRVQLLVDSGKTNEEIIDELFLASLSRLPGAEEKKVALQELEKDRRVGAEDLQWTLVNGIEFILNH